MSRKIIGITVGTPMSPRTLKEKLNPVTSVNGVKADENGNVEVAGGSSWNDLTDKPEIATTEEIVEMLLENDVLVAIADDNGDIITDEDGNIITW